MVGDGDMAGQESLFPLEFFVAGTARSLAASGKSRNDWKDAIRRSAQTRISETYDLGFIDDRVLAVTILYFLSEPMKGDIDNIIKPILDAMIGLVYLNDRVIERVLVQKFEPQVDRLFNNVSAKLAGALDAGPPVVYIRVDDDLSWRTL